MYQIQNRTESSCEILLYSLINHGSTAMSIINQLKAGKNVKEITLRINSDGGDVFEALAVYNYLKSIDAEITVYIDGLAASAASIVACAGRVVMPKNAQLMIHNPWGVAQGDSEEMRAMADILDKIKGSIVSVYAAKSGLPVEEIAKYMDAETWLSAEEAYELGFCDEVQPESEPEEAAEDTTRNVGVLDAVKAERERIRELDALMTPSRRAIIDKAKYETLQDARSIALELLQLQARSEDNEELSVISPTRAETEELGIKSVAEIINQKRGYKNVR